MKSVPCAIRRSWRPSLHSLSVIPVCARRDPGFWSLACADFVSRFRVRGLQPRPGMTWMWLSSPVDNPARIAIILHAAETAALVEVADPIRRHLGLLRHRMFPEHLSSPGRTVAELVGAVIVPPGALVVGRAVQDLEMNVRMVQSDPAELNQVLRLQPDREPAMIERPLAEIADAQTGDLQPVLVGVQRAEPFTEHLADAVTTVRPRRHVGADPVMAWIKAARMVRRCEHDALAVFLVCCF